ncbi:MAG: S41 family peptidase [Proteobacteria bacterium]|nr:S41 family peptidase [Pseudomonadota bacterium]
MKTRMLLAAAAAALLGGALLVGNPAWAAETKKNDAATYRLLNLFGDVFERVRSDYVEATTDQEMIEAAISGMLAALDPHSNYLNAKNFREMQVNTRGEFGGLGIRVTMEGGYVKVISPIDDTPAFRAGIKPSDLITHLDGQAVQGLTLAQAVDKMRGKVGHDIKLTILREGKKPFDVTITRAVIKITSVRSRVEGKVGYIRITSFNEQTDKGLKKEMAKLKKEIGDGIQGYVLDLRNNPGGLLDQAVAVADGFLDKGEIVSTRSRRPEDTQRFNARPGDLADALPLVVLINGGSASASEIVAGALQDHRRAILLGTKSFGKGSVQTIMPLPGHGAMRLTTARYYTPSGRSIQAKGIEPDIEVKQARIETIDEPKLRRESDLRNALDNGDKKTGANPSSDSKDDKKPDDSAGEDDKPAELQDFQLARALDLLRGLALFSGKVVTTTN